MQATPLSPLPVLGFSLSLSSQAVVEADPAPFSNTKEVVILNLGEDAVLLRVVDVSSGLPDAGALTPMNSTILPGGGAVTLAMGPEGSRHPLGTHAYWVSQDGAGSGLNLVFRSEGGAESLINVTYIQCLGGGGGE